MFFYGTHYGSYSEITTAEEIAATNAGILGTYGHVPVPNGYDSSSFSTQPMSYGFAYGNGGWSGQSSVVQAEVMQGIGRGLYDAGKEAVTGLWGMVRHPITTGKNLWTVIQHPVITGKLVWNNVSTSYEEQVIHGDASSRSYYFSKLVGEVGLSLLGTKGLGKVGDLAAAGKYASGTLKYTDEVVNAEKVVLKPVGLPNKVSRNVIDPKVVDEILATEKGLRPNPSTYLSKEYIDSHLAMFEGGVSKIQWGAPTRPLGPPSGTFVMPKSVADDLIAQSGGDVSKLEKLLSLEPGTLGSSPVRVDIPNPTGLRMPDGNEIGANSQWLPGGYTGGGIPEATIDQVPLGKLKVTELFK